MWNRIYCSSVDFSELPLVGFRCRHRIPPCGILRSQRGVQRIAHALTDGDAVGSDRIDVEFIIVCGLWLRFCGRLCFHRCGRLRWSRRFGRCRLCWSWRLNRLGLFRFLWRFRRLRRFWLRFRRLFRLSGLARRFLLRSLCRLGLPGRFCLFRELPILLAGQVPLSLLSAVPPLKRAGQEYLFLPFQQPESRLRFLPSDSMAVSVSIVTSTF